MPQLACLNGTIMPVEEAKIPIWDRGFLFGDAVYEVFRLYEGYPWLEAEHYARLRRSLDALEIGPVNIDTLAERAGRTVAESGIKEATLYIQITRGVAPRAHAFPDPPVEPTELIVVRPYDDSATAAARESGVAVLSQPDPRWKRCDIKSTNLLGNILALQTAKRAGGAEAILFDSDGLVTEATHSSVLWVRDGRLEGTPESPAILPGMTRHFAESFDTSALASYTPGRIAIADLPDVQELLLLGTTIEVLPVVTLDGKPVADGKPGPVTRGLQELYRQAVSDWLGKLQSPRQAGTPL